MKKGERMSEAVKQKISLAHTGRRFAPMSLKARKHMSEAHKGKKRAPFSEEHKRNIGKAHKGLLTGEKHPNFGKQTRPETIERIREKVSGEKSHNWLGGKSFEPYCFKFNRAFKASIREKFGDRCYICGEKNKRKLNIHHIDYAKNSICNGKEWAFVPLCDKHHSETNHNRHFWFNRLINYWALNPDYNFMQGILI
jgi:hypothetical protein